MPTPPCEERDLLAAYYDGELDADARTRVEAHVRGCAACARELELIRAAAEPLRRLRAERLAPAEWSALHAAVDDADDAEDASFVRTAATLGVIAASILIVGLAWLRVLSSASTPTVVVSVPPAPPAPPAPTAPLPWSSPERAWERVAVTLRPDPLTL